MSLDYPNRKAWLAVRATPKGRRARLMRFAQRFVHRYNGEPYNIGRNAAKRKARGLPPCGT